MLVPGSAIAADKSIVTEILYDSVESSDVESIGFHNNTSTPLDLTGWYVLDDDLTHAKAYPCGTGGTWRGQGPGRHPEPVHG